MNSPLQTASQAEASNLSGKRILVIDDDAALLLATCKILRRAGAVVKACAGVPGAVGQLVEDGAGFDLVLTDLRMPLTSGKLVLSLIKTAFPTVPVIIMSAFWSEEAKEECRQLGACSLLDKPVRGRDLVEAVVEGLM